MKDKSNNLYCKKCKLEDIEVHRFHCSTCGKGFEFQHRLGLHKVLFKHDKPLERVE